MLSVMSVEQVSSQWTQEKDEKKKKTKGDVN